MSLIEIKNFVFTPQSSSYEKDKKKFDNKQNEKLSEYYKKKKTNVLVIVDLKHNLKEN